MTYISTAKSAATHIGMPTGSSRGVLLRTWPITVVKTIAKTESPT